MLCLLAKLVPGPQDPRRLGAERLIPVPRDVADDHLVRALRPPPRRRQRTPQTPPLVSHQDRPLVRRHARQAPPRDHRQPTSPRSGVRAHTPRNRERPASMGRRRTLNCKSRAMTKSLEIRRKPSVGLEPTTPPLPSPSRRFQLMRIWLISLQIHRRWFSGAARCRAFCAG